MSKYNLTDIMEEYKIGSGWTKDFDYYGMLRSGLAIKDDTSIEVMKDIVEDFTDVNYHREASHLYDAIEAIEANDGDYDAGANKIEDFQQEIMMTIKSQGMDDKGDDYWGKDLGSFMKKRMSEDKEAVDLAIEASQERAGITVDESFKSLAKKLDKQKGIDKDEAAKIAGSIAAKKAAGAGKGPTTKQKKRMNEVRIDRDVAERIEGMLDRPTKAKFIDAFMDIYSDLLDQDDFFPEDIINHLNNEMHAELAGYQRQGDKLAGISEDFDDVVDDIMATGKSEEDAKKIAGSINAKYVGNYREGLEEDSISGEDDYAEELSDKMRMKEGVVKKIQQALEDDAKGTESEIKMYMDSLRKSGDSFDSIDDYVEDFKNYVADKSLQEHFGRFLKDFE